jgi:diphthine synthase
MLYLIGLGLQDERDLTLRALDVAKKCECYCELYTSIWKGSVTKLEEMLGKKVRLLKRKDLEDNLYLILDIAKERDIAIFVPGDPLIATTHIDIILEAKKEGIRTKILHNASIFSAIGESGLQIYKFGKAATIPLTGKLGNVKNTIKNNRKLGLHTLLLLDLDEETGIYLKVSEALKMLLKERILSKKDRLIVLSNAGFDSEVFYDRVENLVKREFSLPAVLIVPGRLHFREREFLESL